MTRRRAYQLMDGAKVTGNVNNCTQTPTTESQACPLAALPREQQAEAWQEAVDTAPAERSMSPKKRHRTVDPEKTRAAAIGCCTGTPPAESCGCGSRGTDRTGNKSPGGTCAACETKQRTAKGGE